MNTENVVKHLRVLWRTDRIIADIRMRHLLVGLGLRAFAALIAAFGLLMLELSAYFALVQIWSAIWAAAILGGVNFVIAAILFAIGGWTMVVWGVFARVVVGWHTTWFVNSLSHLYGKRPHVTNDDSTNNWFVALLTFGEGWHNNHHAFPTSARHGLKWYQLDMNWITISIFERLGWATKIRIFDAEQPVIELKQAA